MLQRNNSAAFFTMANVLKIFLLEFVLMKMVARATEGSCRAAGYTQCCSVEQTSSPCAGFPPTCFCDPSCKEFNDCCDDLDEICRDPALDETLESLKPVVTYPSDLTFHSALLHWFVLPSTNRVNVNGSYQILLTEDASLQSNSSSSSSSSSSSYSNVSLLEDSSASLNYSIQIRSNSYKLLRGGLQRYDASLYGLKQGTRYRASMVIFTNIGFLNASVVTDFTTMRYNYTGDIKIAIKSSSSVQVSWNPLLVPEGVSVVQYKLSYGLKGRQEKMYRFSSPEDTIRNIHNLHSNGVYTLVVCAVLREKDGSLHTQSLSTRLLGPTSDGDLHFYVPESSYVQLVTSGNSLTNCSDWSHDVESSLKKSFRSSILRELNSHSLYLTSFHVQDAHLMCEVIAIGNQTTSRATYRAEVFGTEHVTSQALVNIVKEWVGRGAVLSYPEVTVLQNKSHYDDISLTKDCPVEIERISEPLCGTGHVQMESTVQEEGDAHPVSVSWEVLVLSLMAELVVLLLLAGTAVIGWLVCTRKRLRSSDDGDLGKTFTKPGGGRERDQTPCSISSHGNGDLRASVDRTSEKVLI